jgi:DNA-binding MarR family transcriptional regulator
VNRRWLMTTFIAPDDRRRMLVEITREGVAVMERLLPELHRAEAEWASGLSGAGQAGLLRSLGRLHSHLPRSRPHRTAAPG